jgi:hypothetical protein
MMMMMMAVRDMEEMKATVNIGEKGSQMEFESSIVSESKESKVITSIRVGRAACWW